MTAGDRQSTAAGRCRTVGGMQVGRQHPRFWVLGTRFWGLGFGEWVLGTRLEAIASTEGRARNKRTGSSLEFVSPTHHRSTAPTQHYQNLIFPPIP